MAETYRMPRRPTDPEWDLRMLWLAEHRSVARVAFLCGIDRADVSRAINVCQDWLQDSGYLRAFREAKEWGFSDADARLRAEQVAAYNEQESKKENA